MPRKATKPKLTFAEKLAAYPTYDTSGGFGSEREWTHAYSERMGLPEAQERMAGHSPRSILGVGANATWIEIKSAFRKLSMQFHPDRIAVTGLTLVEATEKFKNLVAAYMVLEMEFGK